jgi:hypothetical protein
MKTNAAAARAFSAVRHAATERETDAQIAAVAFEDVEEREFAICSGAQVSECRDTAMSKGLRKLGLEGLGSASEVAADQLSAASVPVWKKSRWGHYSKWI